MLASRSGLVVACLLATMGVASCVEPPQTAAQEVLDVCAIANDGDLCDDHQACTYPDVCMNKKCLGMPVVDGTRCTDGNVCTTNDHCVTGVCVATVEPDGTICTDGDPCTDPDICQQGVCLPGGPLVCDDGDSCTIDSCQPGVGCLFLPRTCVLPDAGADATADVAPPVDSGRADAVVDLGRGDLGQADSSPADVQSADVSVVDTGVDTRVSDGGGPDATVADGSGQADAGGGADAAVDLVETPPDLRARGGGCACALSEGSGGDAGSASLLTLLGVLVGMVRRARRRRRKRGRQSWG